MSDTPDTYKYMEPILAKLDGVDGLTNEELKLALVFYRDLEAKLKVMGPRFLLAWFPVMDRVHNLQAWAFSRQYSAHLPEPVCPPASP